MQDLSDTIAAISSPTGGVRSIIRLTGPQAFSTCARFFTADSPARMDGPGIHRGFVRVTDELEMDGLLYLFVAPHSYTGEHLAEVHLPGSAAIAEAFLQRLLAEGLRAAGPGEFTARAYLNGKLDLAQAEAVNEIVSSSNRLQLEAAEKMLSGQLGTAVHEVRSAMVEVLSLLEAGLDFSGEDIEFISPQQATARLAAIQERLEGLLAGSLRYEALMDLPAVGIAGAPNAGKSSLLNALLGWERSIVSHEPKTTRDVLTGVLTTQRVRCVLFDCAGLIAEPESVLDELVQRAAVEALQSCVGVLFCVDASKADLTEDQAIRELVRPRSTVHVATKSDLCAGAQLQRKVAELGRVLGAEVLPVSARTSAGLGRLVDAIETLVVPGASDGLTGGRVSTEDSTPCGAALTARHRQAVTDAVESTQQAIVEMNRGHDEVAVMMIRTAHQAISEIERQPLDEQVLDRIFSRFCIGK